MSLVNVYKTFSLTKNVVFMGANKRLPHFSTNYRFEPKGEVPRKLGILIPEDQWCRFYRFPYINHARLLNRFKLYQTAITLTSVPVSFGLYMNDVVTQTDCLYMVGLASLACSMLYVMGNIFRKLIGIMDINKEGDTIRVSHLTFFGGKNQVILPTENVIPFSELIFNSADLFLKLKRYDSKEELFFIIKYGGITDKEAFTKVFGNHIT